MTTFYLTRHGETQWNIQKRMQGHLDSPLTDLGIAQAITLGKTLTDKGISCIYSSSSGRTLQTSECINTSLGVEIIPKDELKEINLGAWEGKTPEEISAFDAEQYENFWHEPQSFRPKSGEHYYDVSRRAVKLLEQISQFHQGDHVLIVTHAVVLKSIILELSGKDLSQFWSGEHMKPTCLNKVTYDNGQWQIEFIGDTTHYSNIEMNAVKNNF